MRYAILAPAAALVALTACSDVQSDSVLTSGIYADLSVIADGGGTSVTQAVLKVGGMASTTYVELQGDDALTATDGTSTEDMVEQTLFDWHGYVATFDGDDPSTTFTVAFTRTVDDGAPSSTMSLPDPFDVGTMPDSASRAEDLPITWSPSGSGDVMYLDVEGDCIVTDTESITGDPGTFTIPANKLQATQGSEQSTCPLTITVYRSRAGDVDPAYGEGGSAAGIQKRTVTVQSTP